MTFALDDLRQSKILPVVVIDDAGMASDVVVALMEGGIRCAEITLRTEAGIKAIVAASGIPGFATGAGTVLSTAQIEACADAGASFIVSPGLDEDVVGRSVDLGLFALPGVATATEIQRAVRMGLTAVKFFPAKQLGGLQAIDALAGP